MGSFLAVHLALNFHHYLPHHPLHQQHHLHQCCRCCHHHSLHPRHQHQHHHHHHHQYFPPSLLAAHLANLVLNFQVLFPQTSHLATQNSAFNNIKSLILQRENEIIESLILQLKIGISVVNIIKSRILQAKIEISVFNIIKPSILQIKTEISASIITNRYFRQCNVVLFDLL